MAMRPYLPLSTSPFTSQRCSSITTSTGGSITSRAAFMAMFQAGSVSDCGIRFFRPITAVAMLLSVVNSSGQRYWFQP